MSGLAVDLVTLWTRRGRVDWRERVGVSRPLLPYAPVWIHGASVGEIRAAVRLGDQLELPILLTSDTDTGAACARDAVQSRAGWAAGVRPLDHPLSLLPWFAETRPRGLVFIENTWWPTLARIARQRAGIPVVRLGTRPSGLPEWWYRWCSHEAPAQPGPVCSAAVPLPPLDPKRLPGRLPAARLVWKRPFWVGACTRSNRVETELVRAAATHGRGLVLAPRHLDRIDRVVQSARSLGASVRRLSELPRDVPEGVDVIVVDHMGALARCYVGAEAAYIGGTFDPALGGHSGAEALDAVVPRVAGPYRHANLGTLEGARLASSPGELGDALSRASEPVAPSRASISPELSELFGVPGHELSPRPWARGHRVIRWLQHLRPVQMAPPVPVIAVGSRNARGGGKTTTARVVAGVLRQRGLVVGVVVRGHGRSHRSLRVSWQCASASELSDEGVLHRLDGSLVAACPDRQVAMRALVRQGAQVVVLDDGLSWRGPAWMSIEVRDPRFPNARGPLPRGEQRPLPLVQASRSHRFDAAVRGGPLRRGQGALPLDEGYVLLAGAARPDDGLDLLERPPAKTYRLKDHELAPPGLLEAIAEAGLPVVCTAKVRAGLPAGHQSQVYWRDLQVELPAEVVSDLERLAVELDA